MESMSPWIEAFLVAIVGSGGFWAYLQSRRSRKMGIDGDSTTALKERSADWQAFVDKLTDRMDAQQKEIDSLKASITELGNQRLADALYISDLLNHIEQHLPPPPPPRRQS